jgi:hypothetical protein
MDSSRIARQCMRDYYIQNNYLNEFKEIKNTDSKKRNSSGDTYKTKSSEESEDDENQLSTTSLIKSSKNSSRATKQNDSGDSGDSGDSDNSENSDKRDDSDNSDNLSNSPNNHKTEKKDLTVLYYMQSSGDGLGEKMGEGIIDLERIGSTDDINIVAQYNRKEPQNVMEEHIIDGGWAGTRRYFITKDENPGFNPITLESLLEISEKVPDNPLFKEAIAQKYKEIGNEDKAEEFWEKAQQIKKTLTTDEANKGIEEYFSIVESNFCDRFIFRDNLCGFDRAGEREIKSEILEELPEIKKGEEAAALQDFIEWGMESYPAENYILVLGGHGWASRGSLYMSPSEISEALTNGVENANSNTGAEDSIDALVFNSCFMGSLEVMSELKDNASVIISSQNKTGHRAFYQWDNILQKVQDDMDNNQSFDVKKFARDFVDYFKVEDGDKITSEFFKGYYDISAIDTNKIPELLKSFNNLLETCDNEGVSDKQLFKAIANTTTFKAELFEDNTRIRNSDAHLKDLGGFLENLQEDADMPESVKKSAKKTLEVLAETLIRQQHNTNISDGQGESENATGLTIWAPDNSVDYDGYPAYTDNVPNFASESLWPDRLKGAADNIPEDLKAEADHKLLLAALAANNTGDDVDDRIKKINAELIENAKEIKKETYFHDENASA